MAGRYPMGVLSVSVPPEDVDVNVHPTKIEVRFAQSQAVFDAVRRTVTRTLRAQSPSPVPAAEARQTHEEQAPVASRFDGDAVPLLRLDDPNDDTVRVLGQIDRTFIVGWTPREVVVMDQHAAHERIAYEAILESERAVAGSAPLLIPMVVELTPAQASTLHEFHADLSAAGVSIEPFGDDAYRIVSLPLGYESRQFDLAGMLDDIAGDASPRDGPARRNRVLATIACHAVVRAGDALSAQEQIALFERLARCKEPQTCPHGRPTTVRLNAEAFAKAFKRG
ncbi:MAG TPA: hypothetical protein VEJ20_07195, partial [Candidatus Eremiobacteraceae bacterium]|nr:hypothetical protein [Candidatus Eremiobacteraceae bacterium]